MNWFKNLNARSRLLISFGVLIILIGAISSLSITALREGDDRIGSLYHEDMMGAIAADELAVARLSLGRQGRDAILHIEDVAVVSADKRTMVADFVKIHSSLEEAEKKFHSKEGKALIAIVRNTLPAYEKVYHDLYERIDANDLAGAKTVLAAITTVGQPLYDAVDRARAIKEGRAEEQFQANTQSYHTARAWILAVSAISLALGIMLSIFVARGFSIPLGQAVATLALVAGGDLTVSLDVRTRDEVGQMARALNSALEKLRFTLQEVTASAAKSNSSSRELAAAAGQIASGAQEQAASLEETSASLEQITATVRQSADNARQASQLATGARESAEQGQGVVSSAIVAMGEINAASAKIADITSTINEIAFQTNLLAVNAAVEAARAGEEGRGFAVVATEVRSLAQRSADAAKEIKGLIQDTLQKVEKGSELVNRSGATLQGIVSSVKRVTDIVAEIAAASAEQSLGVDQVNTAITQMDQVTQSNSSQTEELAATAQSFADQATGLMDLVSSFALGNSRQSPRVEPGHQPLARNHPHSTGAAQRPLKPATKVAAGKLTSSAPNGRTKLDHSAVLVPIPVGRSDDASFEEF
jgi:methyl-accepting chemotaxis protein